MRASPHPPDRPGCDAEAAFVALLTAAQTTIALAIRGLMPGDGGVDEVIQQTNVKIWQKRDEFELGTNFKAWAVTIARYEVLNYRKQQARDARLRFSDDLETQIAEEISQLDDTLVDRQLALRECLQQIKPESRELLLSRYASDETLSDYATRVGRSVGGVKVTLCRLRSALSACIERRMAAGGESA